MKRGWVNKSFQYLKLGDRISPADNVRYYFSIEVLEFTESPAKQGNPSRGKARFLVENAPEKKWGSENNSS